MINNPQDWIKEYVSDIVHREHFQINNRVPAYGFIERFELTPAGLLPNMDAGPGGAYRLECKLVAPSGDEIPLDAVVICRGIKSPQEVMGDAQKRHY